MHTARLSTLAQLLALLPDDPNFSIYGFEGRDGRYDASVYAARQPCFVNMGFELIGGQPSYEFVISNDPKRFQKRREHGVAAIGAFFGISTADARLLFGPLGYQRAGGYIAPREVAQRIKAYILEKGATYDA